MKRVIHVTTVPESLMFIAGMPAVLRGRGYELIAVSSPGGRLTEFGRAEGVEVHGLEMPRAITPFADLRTVARLTSLFKKLSPDLVHAHTPKGGLLGMLAAAAARVPVRVYQMRGLPFVTATGARRALLKSTERTSCALAHQVICQSRSLLEVAEKESICSLGKMDVLLAGGNGVDAAGRFNPARIPNARAEVRARLGLAPDAWVVGFVGRLVRDKGVIELFEAWTRLRSRFPKARLLLVGDYEPGDPVPPQVRQALERDERVVHVGWSDDTPPLYAAMDAVALPTYREGFPNVPVEAAAMRLPVVATRIPGCVDAINDGVTGTLVPPREPRTLTEALARYAEAPALARRHGEAARARVELEFKREAIFEALGDVYDRLLSRRTFN
jgi:glycosyltransferase involved in cell wall biosynthesis